MRVHALLLTLVVLLGLPTSPLLGAQSADAIDWQAAQRLVRRGDYAQAEDLYASFADRLGPDQAPRALVFQARAALADADTDRAEDILQNLLARYPNSADAYFTLEQVRRAGGDCAGSLRALDAFE